jgi:PKD repeat protein
MGPSKLKLTATIAAMVVILFAPNFTITNADKQQYQQQDPQQYQQQDPQQYQQQALLQLFLQQLLTQQPATVEKGTTTSFQSTNDSFSIQVPRGWIIQDQNNTGLTLAAEVLQGYGVLAQLCPAEQQQEALLTNTGSNTSNISNSTNNGNSCQRAQEVIHVVRYPNLDARLGFASDDDDDDDGDDVGDGVATTNSSNISPDTILAFQMLKLQEAGYNDIRIVDSIDMTIDVISSVLNNNVIATVPAKFVEMTYSTNLDQNETRTGYFLSTATDLTPRNLGMTTGYGVFYEHSSTTAETMTASSRLPPPAPIIQVFDSFELIAGAEVEQAIVAALYGLVAPAVNEEQVAEDVLTAEIDSNDTEGTAPATFEFEADITGGTEPYTISWDLDDDGIAESNEQTLVATFNEAGTYDGILTVTDSEGQTASDTVEITVEEGEEEEVASTEEEEEQPIEDEEESLTEETTQEETSCHSLYPITCMPSYTKLNQSCNDIPSRNSEALPQDALRFNGNDDSSSDSSSDTGCDMEDNQDGLGEPDNNNFGSDNLLDLYGSRST